MELNEEVMRLPDLLEINRLKDLLAEAYANADEALENLEMPCHTDMAGVRPAKTIRALGE